MFPSKTAEAVQYAPPQSILSSQNDVLRQFANKKVLLASIVTNLIPVLIIFWFTFPSDWDFPAVEVFFITIFAVWILSPYVTTIFLAFWLNEKRVAKWTVLATSILSCLVSVGCLDAAFTMPRGGYYFVMMPIILFPFLLTGFLIALVAWTIENRKTMNQPNK